jgi:hypothetical protein
VPEPEDEDCRLILTAAHLFSDVDDGVSVLFGLAGPEPNSTDNAQYCGTIRRRVPLHHLPSIGVDAAVVKPRRGLDCRNQMECGAPTGIRDLNVLDDPSDQSRPVSVRKHGAQTGLTAGELLPVVADVYMENVRARYTSGWWAYGDDGTAFVDGGDSGAIVLDEGRRIVGMVVGVDSAGNAAYIHGIKQLFAALQIALL